jgi:hypothetical protein
VVAVVDTEPAAVAVLARLGHVDAQVVDDQADADRSDPGDALAGLRVGRVVVVGAEDRVDELCRRLSYAAGGSSIAARRVRSAGFWLSRGVRWFA